MKSSMRALDPSHVLELAERGRAKSPPERAVLLLSAAFPDRGRESLENISIGERDALLLKLRERIFGKQLRGLITCPACSLALSIDINTDTLRSDSDHPGGPRLAQIAGYEVRFRAPNTGDLRALAETSDAERGWVQLLERCILDAKHDSQTVPPGALPPEVAEEISRLMDEADPRADLQLAMDCPACGESWSQTFDIVSYLWDELGALARQLLFEVHALASAYGWSEKQILRMSPWRRGMYLAMVNE
jgi:hypothetical protein